MPTWRGCLMSISGLSGLELDASTSEFVTSLLRSSLETCEKLCEIKFWRNFITKMEIVPEVWVIRHPSLCQKFCEMCVEGRKIYSNSFGDVYKYLQYNFFVFMNNCRFHKNLVWQFDSLKSLGQLVVCFIPKILLHSDFEGQIYVHAAFL